VHEGIRRVAEGVAAAHGVEVDVELIIGYPVTSNDDRFADFTLEVANSVAGREKVRRLPHPVMGAEDFSYVLDEIPGTMMFLGGTSPDRDPASAAPNHSNRVVFDEDAMATGIELYSAVALHHLHPHTN
jgi:metal-dependent amidase/aminoacylase/carboxypeptidase family protein